VNAVKTNPIWRSNPDTGSGRLLNFSMTSLSKDTLVIKFK